MTTVVTVAVIAAQWAAVSSAGAAPKLPVPYDAGSAIAPALFPDVPPPGANVPGCRPSSRDRNPVILINGTFLNQSSWQTGAPLLRNNGYCVFTFNYGNPRWISEIPIQAVDDVRISAQRLAAEVAKVRELTGAPKVDLVGYSQGGGLLPIYYLNRMGGHRYVDKLIGIAPSNHGTSASGIVFLRKSFPPLGPLAFDVAKRLIPAALQQFVGSPLVAETYGRGDTRPGVTYTTLVSKYDEVVTPYTNQFLAGPDVTNITMQTGCDRDVSDHISMPFSPRTWRYVLNALDPTRAVPVPCVPVGFIFPGLN